MSIQDDGGGYFYCDSCGEWGLCTTDLTWAPHLKSARKLHEVMCNGEAELKGVIEYTVCGVWTRFHPFGTDGIFRGVPGRKKS